MEVQSRTPEVIDSCTLKQRYLDACKRYRVLPNDEILSSLFKAGVGKSHHGQCILWVFLDHLKNCDFLPLFDLFSEIDTSEIDAVDISNEKACALHGDYALSLMRLVHKKLRIVDLIGLSLGRDYLWDLSQGGLACKVLHLQYSHFRKLNLIGSFGQIVTLNLDFSTSLTSFTESCFICMPSLKHLSMCATRVSNLWTTGAALSKLPSLVELRFQNCICCNNTGPCLAASDAKRDENGHSTHNRDGTHVKSSSTYGCQLNLHPPNPEYMLQDMTLREDVIMNDVVHSSAVDFPAGSDMDFLIHDEGVGVREMFDAFPRWDARINSVVPFWVFWAEDRDLALSTSFSNHVPASMDALSKKYLSHHPSPICFAKHYREYMLATLSQLKVLDNLPISAMDREMAEVKFVEKFEFLPYRRRHRESLVGILNKREIRGSQTCLHKQKSFATDGKSQISYSRSLGAAKVGSCTWPLLHPLPTANHISGDESRSFRPRQFEYHPSISSLMVFGTLDGEVVVVNHENENIVSYVPSLGGMDSVLGLCWLKSYPSKLIAGSENGLLRLYDIQQWSSTVNGKNVHGTAVSFDDFDQLTSVHANSTDELFLASGYSKNVALYDINIGKRIQVFNDMHQQHINVVKFSNNSPSIFATSSFDQDVKMWDLRQKPLQPCYRTSSSRGNVMVCFSADDHYLLVSAVDNEVKQLSAADGRILVDFEIASTGSSQNYTRSYYMNGRDYIISGSCDENVVRVCCAQSGRRLRDISLEARDSGASMFVQSLKGDPFRDFNMSVLAAYMHPSSKSEIIKVNLLASCDQSLYRSECDGSPPSCSFGG